MHWDFGGLEKAPASAHMRELIGVHIKQASLRGTGQVVVQHYRRQSMASTDVQPAAEPADPIQPLLVRTGTAARNAHRQALLKAKFSICGPSNGEAWSTGPITNALRCTRSMYA
jgi:hypothetical protein